MSFLRRVKDRFARFIYVLLYRKKTIDLAAFFGEEMAKSYHLIVTLRYMYLRYKNGGNSEFYQFYSRALSYIPSDVFQEDCRNFDSLFRSFEKRGFNESRPITVDLDQNLIDGTHRIACCIFFGIRYVKARIVGRHLSPISLDDKIKNLSLSEDDVVFLKSVYREMLEKLKANGN